MAKSTREGTPRGCPKGRPEHLCSVLGVGALGCGAKQRKPDAWATYPDHHGLVAFKFGDEFVSS